MQFGGAYMDRLEEIVSYAASTGLGVESMVEALLKAKAEIAAKVVAEAQNLFTSLTPILTDLQTRVDAYLASIPEGLGVLNSAELEGFRADAVAFAGEMLQGINAMIAAGQSIPQILGAVGPQMDQLKALLVSLGLTMGDVGLGWLAQQQRILKTFPEEIALLNAVQQNMQAMMSLGITTDGRCFCCNAKYRSRGDESD